MRNVRETGINRPYVMRKDNLYDALPKHLCMNQPDHHYGFNTYGGGYRASAGGALLKGGTPNGAQGIPTAQINSLAAFRMGKIASHQVDWGGRSYDDSTKENLAGGSTSLLHLYDSAMNWSNSRKFVNPSTGHSSGVEFPMLYHLRGEANSTMGGRRIGLNARGEHSSGRSVSELSHHNQRVQKMKESHGEYFPLGMQHTKRTTLLNSNFMGSPEQSIRGEALHSWWDQRGMGSPSREVSNGYPLPGVRYNKVESSPKGMMGVVLVPANGETKNGFTKWNQNGKEIDAGLIHKCSNGQLSRTSEYSYKDVEPIMYGSMAQGSTYPDDVSVESLPMNSSPWWSNEGFVQAKDNNHFTALTVEGRNYRSDGQSYDQSDIRRLSGENLQRGVMSKLEEGRYTDGLESLDSIPPVGAAMNSLGKPIGGAASLSNEETVFEEDGSRLTQWNYNKGDFTEWISHNRLLKNIISSHKEDGLVEGHVLYSLLFDAYGQNKETFRSYVKGDHDKSKMSMDEEIGEVIHEIRTNKKKEERKKSNRMVEKIIFLKYLFNQYAHTDYANFISFKCFKKMFEDYKNVFSSEKIILFIFNCLDRCRRYYVSESDFLIGMLACSPQMENDITKDTGKLRHQLIFRAYDLDRDGYWNKEEVFVFLYHLYELSKNMNQMELKGNKKKMKKFVAVERDKLMNTCEKISYDKFYKLVLDGKIEGTENLLRSNCDVASVVKTYFLYTYAGGSSLTMSIDTGASGNADSSNVQEDGQIDREKCEEGEETVNPVEKTQLEGRNTQQSSYIEFSGESTTGDPNSEEAPHISATSIKGEDEPEEGEAEEVVQKRSVDGTSSSNNTEGGKSEDRIEVQSEEKPQSDEVAVVGEEPPCGHGRESQKVSDLNSADGKDEEVGLGEEEKVEKCDMPSGVSDQVSNDVSKIVPDEMTKDVSNNVVEGREANADLSVPPEEKTDKAAIGDSIPHLGEGQDEECAHKDNLVEEEERANPIRPERSWRSCVEKIKEIVKAYRKKYLTEKTRLFGLNQDIAFKIFTAFYKVSYKRKREKYIRQFDHLCTGACTYNDIILLCDEAVKVFKGEDTIEYVDLPCKVFGDLHGSIFDLLDFFNMYNWPMHGETNEWLNVEEVSATNEVSLRSKNSTDPFPYVASHDKDIKYIFLGNYINRGDYSLEVICLLLSLKILFPKHIYLLRGNHEERLFNYVHGFYGDIEKKMERNIKRGGLIRYQGEVIQAHAYELFNRINDALEFLPLSVLVGQSILCVHAGIGDSLENIEDFSDVHKPIVVPQCVDRTSKNEYERVQKIIIDTLWSDPINYEDEEDMLLLEKVKPGGDTIPSSRGEITLKFGQRRLSCFLKKNKLKMIIRGHECVQEGYRYSYNRRLLTLFSAKNYCNSHGNDAANAFIVKRGKNIAIFNQILKCPRGRQLEGIHHGEEATSGPVDSTNKVIVNRNGFMDESDPMMEEEEEEMEGQSCRKVDEGVTPFGPNEKNFISEWTDAVDKALCNSGVEGKDDLQSNHILRDSHSIVKRKLRDTRSNEDMKWGVSMQLEKREGAHRMGGHDGDGDRDGDYADGQFLIDSCNSIKDDHSNGDARGDNFEGGTLRKSISTNGTFSSEEGLYGGCSNGSNGRNYTGEMLSSKQYHFKGDGLEKGKIQNTEIERAHNRQSRKSHLKGDAYWEEKYLYDDYQGYLNNVPDGDGLKNSPSDERASSDELPCEGQTEQDSRVNTNAIIEKFFQQGRRDYASGEYIYTDHLEEKEVEMGGNLNHCQSAKLTPLSKQTNDVNIRRGDEGGEWGDNGNCAKLMDELMSKPMDYMMMPPDLGLVNRPKLRRDTHSHQQKKEQGSATLRSLRSLRSENNTSEPLTKLQMQYLPPDPKPQTKISLQKIIDKFDDDA
ncbi:serine/threonine protein phosphatase 8, putative [Plasmodium knowlesi strain H]|uniref:Serine/threonine-protein phosphatase n=3 Tax=Plasmodium knowlesi TaxID=5850 RepID=A0A5K1VNS0_PLAKH|nr:serine/threonine protein phosphatase 8, putative [Plasmodium knowlesi strain H]OTN68202.1 Serine/threonine-protein phosphatase [Plasmodium knowlesi]CAA9987074.1 serine/threonine protein phosphatase 8, putative [Plasmodium knowlesi strain H]SBO23801.1 serine/threonine protein phosphatase 8, putative [Plasmodium knowlesi strain H]SBO25542.1 serine/threonine protein phosphatase 8, putative [Plasmodium knowlesi strain H]VVS76548.1 serine/threonine protein phosphatase 8, putative [Plasmodium kno|eukprot:XP_002261697.1 Erythrocyte membrane-associated antigen,putative [Plasmodium knowlesi strain H]